MWKSMIISEWMLGKNNESMDGSQDFRFTEVMSQFYLSTYFGGLQVVKFKFTVYRSQPKKMCTLLTVVSAGIGPGMF